MIRFEDLIEKVRATHPDADVELLRRAYVFSAYEHKGQVRHLSPLPCSCTLGRAPSSR